MNEHKPTEWKTNPKHAIGSVRQLQKMAEEMRQAMSGVMSSAEWRHDPRRPKTDEDMRKMEAAKARRERRAARKGGAK